MIKNVMYFGLFFLFSANSISIILFGVRLPIFIGLLIFFSIVIGIYGFLDLKNRNWYGIRENYIAKGTRYYVLFMILWLIYAALSFFWQRDFAGWMMAINFLVIGNFCAFLFPFFLKSRQDVFRTYGILGISVLAHNLIGWFEVITRIYLFPSLKDAAGWDGRPVSVFYNTNNFSVFLFFGVFILCANFQTTQNKVVKSIWFLGMLSSILLIFLTGSRGGLLTLGIGGCIFVFLRYFDYIKRGIGYLWKRKAILFVTAILVVIVLGAGYFAFYQIFFTGERATSGISRVNLINNGVMFLGITYGRGVGAGNIEFWVRNYWGYFTYGIVNMHNWWFEILTAYGVVIFLLYLVFYVKLSTSSFMRYVKEKDSGLRAVHMANLCILGGFIVASTIPSSIMPVVWFWAFMGVLIGVQKECIYE